MQPRPAGRQSRAACTGRRTALPGRRHQADGARDCVDADTGRIARFRVGRIRNAGAHGSHLNDIRGRLHPKGFLRQPQPAAPLAPGSLAASLGAASPPAVAEPTEDDLPPTPLGDVQTSRRLCNPPREREDADAKMPDNAREFDPVSGSFRRVAERLCRTPPCAASLFPSMPDACLVHGPSAAAEWDTRRTSGASRLEPCYGKRTVSGNGAANRRSPAASSRRWQRRLDRLPR